MSNDIFLKDTSTMKTCKCCGKKFDIVGMPDYIFHSGSNYYCSWTCYNKSIKRPVMYVRSGGRNK